MSRSRLDFVGMMKYSSVRPASERRTSFTLPPSIDSPVSGSRQLYELLLMRVGLLAVLLTLAKYGIQWATPPGVASSQYGTVATALVINVVLGGALWASSAISRKNLMNGAIVAAVISLVLIYYGGQSGQIGGVVGIFGAILAAAKPYLPWSRRSQRD